MMGPGAAKVETCLDIIREVKGWDLQKEAKAFLDAAKKSAEAEKEAGTVILEAKKAEEAADRKVKSVQRRETGLKNDRAAFRKEREEWAEAMKASGASLEAERTRFANSVAAVAEREARANEKLAAAEATKNEALDILKRAEAKEAALKPKLDLIEKLRA